MAAAEGYRNFLVRHLRMICSQRKLSPDGSKEELLHRLADHDSQQGASPSSIRLSEVMELPEVPPQVHPTAKSLEPTPERQQQLIAEACSEKATVPNSPGKLRARRMLPVPLKNRPRGAKSSASSAGNVERSVVDESQASGETSAASTSEVGGTLAVPKSTAKMRPLLVPKGRPQRPLLVAKAKAKRQSQPSQMPLSQETLEDPNVPQQSSQEARETKDNGLTVFEIGGPSPAESSDAEDMEDVLACLPSTRAALRAAVEESSCGAGKETEKSDDSKPNAQEKHTETTTLTEADAKAGDASSETSKTIGAKSSMGEIVTPANDDTKVADLENTSIEWPEKQDGNVGDPSELQLLTDEMKTCGQKVLDFDLDFALEQHRQEQIAKRLAEIREARAANLTKQGQLRQALEIARAKMEKSRQAVLERAEKRFQLRQEWEVLAQDPDWASKLEETQEKLRLQEARKLARKQFWEVRASQTKRTATEMGETRAKGPCIPKSKTVLPARLQEEFMAKRSRC